MGVYIVRRLLLSVPTLLIVTITVAFLIRIVPGDVVDLMIGENQYAGDSNTLRVLLGVDQPFPVQYAEWLGNAVRGDFGESLWSGRSAVEELKSRLPVTLELGVLTLFFSLIVSVPAGVIAALKRDSWVDLLARLYVIAGLSVPSFWLATIVVVAGSLWFRWTPELTHVPLWEDPVRNLRQLTPPAIILGAFGSATLMRITRTTVLEVMRQDYIRTAHAKGLTERRVIIRHVMRNSLIPIITIIGLQIPFIISGSVVMEQIFGIPGMGKWLLEVVQRRDYPMLQAANLFFAMIVIGTNLATDMAYAVLDPRIRYS